MTLIASALLMAALVVDGIYPHLAMQNNEGECGTGAVVPWAGSLWVVTYGPHCPLGSSDKLYQIKPDLSRVVRAESVGGTPANRMIHRESNQLFIGPYAIDAKGNVRVIEPKRMPGRPVEVRSCSAATITRRASSWASASSRPISGRTRGRRRISGL